MYAAAARPLMMVAQICGREGWAIEDAHASMLRRRYIEVPVRWLQGMGPRSHTTGSLGKRDFCMSFALFEKTQGRPAPELCGSLAGADCLGTSRLKKTAPVERIRF